MRILVVGGGGREHALVHALSRSHPRPELLAAPGNPGTGSLAENIPVRADDVDALVDLARGRAVDLVVVGPEVPLVLGLADRLAEQGIPVFGPTAAAARLEGSKAFAKDFMERHGIPTAAYRTFTADEHAAAVRFVREQGAPIVVKASGLAAGKGAVVCATVEEAVTTLDSMLREREFGSAGDFVVVESFMEGEEASLFAVCDGTDYVLLASAQDHKRIGEEDTGPNTGGMGAYAPAPLVDERVLEAARTQVIEPTLRGMAAEGMPYRGVLYVGLMISGDAVRVVEFNCRFGDPEAQVILPLLSSDAAVLFYRAAAGSLSGYEVVQQEGAAACVVLAASGYPGPYPKGQEIRGLEQVEDRVEVVAYHAGTARRADGTCETAGGRVLTIAATGSDLAVALDRAYTAAAEVSFDGMQYRRDIGRKGLRRLGLVR